MPPDIRKWFQFLFINYQNYRRRLTEGQVSREQVDDEVDDEIHQTRSESFEDAPQEQASAVSSGCVTAHLTPASS